MKEFGGEEELWASPLARNHDGNSPRARVLITRAAIVLPVMAPRQVHQRKSYILTLPALILAYL
jgi:hypothetical protein